MKKKIEKEASDELRSEYDLKELRVRKKGIGRRRREILENARAGLSEFRDGTLTSSSDVETLMEDLSHD
jgi:hypothetical protein